MKMNMDDDDDQNESINVIVTCSYRKWQLEKLDDHKTK